MRIRRNAKRLILVALAITTLTAISLMWLRSTPVSANSADRVREAREALEQARAVERNKPTKDNGQVSEAALQAYNEAVNERIAEILERVGELNELMGLNTNNAFDIRGAIAKRPDATLQAEYDALQAELAVINPEPLAPGNLNTVTEVEPNNTAATANALNLNANGCRVASGAITAGDIDFWSFTAPAGSRVWAYVDTGGGQSSPLNDRDSFLTLFNTDGTTIIEEDDDDARDWPPRRFVHDGSANDLRGGCSSERRECECDVGDSAREAAS